MKKRALLLALGLLCSCQSLPEQTRVLRANSLTIEDLETNFDSFFASNYASDTIQKDLLTGEVLSIHDEVGSKKKATIVKRGEEILSQTFIVSQNSIAVEQYLDITNTITTRSLDTDEALFSKTYGTPLANVIGTKALSDYFTLETSGENPVLKANDLALVALEQGFEAFFPFYEDENVYDPITQTERLVALSIETNSEGTPLSMTFEKAYGDRYGATLVEYTSTLSAIESVSGLSKSTFGGTSEQRAALSTSLNNLYTAMLGGNFCQSVDMATSNFPKYHNYYNFAPASAAGAMISDRAFSSEYGWTYSGMGVNRSGQYYMAGVSPEADYYGAASSNTYDTFAEILPLYKMISPDFFAYDEATRVYSFDLESFPYNDYQFSLSVLDALFGQGDPLAQKMGAYLASTSHYYFDFKTLDVVIDDAGYPQFTLTFQPYFTAAPITVTTSFSSFGEVNLSADPDLSAAFSLLIGE